MLGVILAGGKGSRCLPFTKINNKHLAPVYTEDGAIPMIYYPISTLVKSGCTKILIVSSQEHCGSIIEYCGDGYEFGCEFTYRIQDHTRVTLGIASALNLAQDFTKDERFAVILGDNFYSDSFSNEFDIFNNADYSAHIFLKPVDDVRRFGCATINKIGEVEKIVEKPTDPESNLAVTGLYLYDPSVYHVARTLKPSHRGELEITDINYHYAQNKKVDSTTIGGFWHDMGVPESMIKVQDYINTNNYKI
jgi:glucose-1-phosphate thymidylyltransferase